MNHIAQKIAGHAKNGVVPLSVLKERNYPLFKYFTNNFKPTRRMLQDNGYYVLNDLRTLNTDKKLKYYILYRYTEVVNLSVLRTADRNAYNYLSYRGEPADVLREMGFEVTWNRKGSMDAIKVELYRLADKDGYIYKMDSPSLYSKLYYRARKVNQSVKEYIKQFGYTYQEYDYAAIKRLRGEGKSVRIISETLEISPSTIRRLLKEMTTED